MRILVTTASRHGRTTAVGDAVAATLRGGGHVVERRELEHDRGAGPAGLDAEAVTEDVDAVVIGGAVYAGHWLEAAVEAQRTCLAREVLTFAFAVGIQDVSPDPSAPRWTAPRTSASSHERVTFGGRLDKGLLSFGERALVALVRAKEGDSTTWGDVEAWAGAVGREVAVHA